ncbi:MAG: hypothetical protein HY883_02445 [Deltaproteobacteria bacterium]|nr:hypothetical protein [Deltaproteobacteria bacterium]
MAVIFISTLVFLSAICLPGIAGAKTRVYVAVAISGGFIAAGAYIAWSFFAVERVSSPQDNLPQNEVSDITTYAVGDKRVEMEAPEIYMPLLSVRF